MVELFGLFGLSLGLCLILTPAVRRLAVRLDLVDRPDGRRKIHVDCTPVAGGLAVLVSVLIAFGLALWRGELLRGAAAGQAAQLLGWLAAGLLICAVGVLDDYRTLRGRTKLLGQVVACGLVMASGVMIRNVRLFDWELELGLLAVPCTLFWLLGAINSLNLLDGMDGLLSTVGLIIFLAMAALGVQVGNAVAAGLAVAFAGALLGFLRYNFPPASIFLGDSGSMLIGLSVGVLAIQSSLKGPATVALAAPTAVLIIPIFDTAAAILRRRLTGRSIYSTDRGHLHHCLLRRGLSREQVLLWVSSLCLLAAAGTIGSLAFRNELLAVAAALLVVGILVVTRAFGYAEFLLVRERLIALGVSFVRGPARGSSHELEVHLQGSADWNDLWRKLVGTASELELATIYLDVNAPADHEGYHARWENLGQEGHEGDEAGQWKVVLPLLARGRSVGRLEVKGCWGKGPIWKKIITVSEIIENIEATLAGRARPPLVGADEPEDEVGEERRLEATVSR